MSDLLIGQTVGGKYKILELIGHGGMANVYKAYQEDKNRFVAVKVMHSFLVHEQDFLPRFKREARAMAVLKHPRIVKIYDFAVQDDLTYYLVMQYLNGGTIKQKLEQAATTGQHLPVRAITQIGGQVAEALAYAHSHDMVHRDIKSGNILLDDNGSVYLTDFGIVKMVGGQSAMVFTTTGTLIGSPAYMSPEQALGKPGDARSDIYSLGVLLFQISTNKLPFDADSALGVVLKHVNVAPPSPSSLNAEIPTALQDVILKAMAKDPADRYQSANDIALTLQGISQNLGSTRKMRRQTKGSGGKTAVSSPLPPSPAPPAMAPPQPVTLPAPWLKEIEIICPHCQSAIDIHDHGPNITCHTCQNSYILEEHMCPYCHSYHKEATKFCRTCGEAIVRSCHRCFTPNWAGDDHCKECDAPLDLLEMLQSRSTQTEDTQLEAQIKIARQIKDTSQSELQARLQIAHNAQAEVKKRSRRRRLRQAIGEFVFFFLALAAIAAVIYYISSYLL